MLESRRSFRPTKLLIAVSLCCGSVLTVPSPAFACQAGEAGCVLPVGRTAPPPPPPAPAPVVTPTVYEEGGGGIPWLPILLGLAALAAIIYVLTKDNNDDEAPISP